MIWFCFVVVVVLLIQNSISKMGRTFFFIAWYIIISRFWERHWGKKKWSKYIGSVSNLMMMMTINLSAQILNYKRVPVCMFCVWSSSHTYIFCCVLPWPEKKIHTFFLTKWKQCCCVLLVFICQILTNKK